MGSIYKRFFSTTTVVCSITVVWIVHVIVVYHAQRHHSVGSSGGGSVSEWMADFVDVSLSSSSYKHTFRVRTTPISVTRESRRTSTTKKDVIDRHHHEIDDNEEQPEIKLLFTPQELQWVQQREDLFDQWYNQSSKIIQRNSYPLGKATKANYSGIKSKSTSLSQSSRTVHNGKHPSLHADYFSPNASTNEMHHPNSHFKDPTRQEPSTPVDVEGPWLDFVIIGNPKCGTSTLMANLGHLAPMPVKDVCIGPGKTLQLAYHEWPRLFARNLTQSIVDNHTLLRGSKCPRMINEWLIKAFATSFQRTKFIVGIRHPVHWFNSFWRMMAGGNPYRMMDPCPCLIDERTGKRDCPDQPSLQCFGECPDNQVFCLHRSRMHLPLARLGKTLLTEEERTWLAPRDIDGGHRLISWNVSNPIFLYDQTQMKDDSYWDYLANFLRVSHIPNTRYHGSKGKEQSHKSLCDAEYDVFRSVMMSYSYEMSVWLQQYFVPVARDPRRSDVIIPNIVQFVQAVETYKHDPCQRLIRNDENGAYVLNPKLGEIIHEPPKPSFIMHRPQRILKTKRGTAGRS